MPLSGSFSYVFVPANEEAPIEAREGDKSGGLSDDVLVKTAKDFFFQQSGGETRAEALNSASPEERKTIAQQIRAQVLAKNPNAESHIAKMDDDALISLVRYVLFRYSLVVIMDHLLTVSICFFSSTQASPSCEIIALTVPTKGNQYRAVSMYVGEDSLNAPFNRRATALMQACGHALPAVEGKEPGVYGDVFVGRCYDNEESDEWHRVDLAVSEVENPTRADWCAIARSKGGGGGSGAEAASLSGVMTQTISSPQSKVTWSQTDDEVELKFQVPSGTKAKYVKVNFAKNSLKVTAAGQTLIQGSTGGKVAVDESTYTIQDADDGRELCVILSKKESGTIWPHAVESN
jgi:CS domain